MGTAKGQSPDNPQAQQQDVDTNTAKETTAAAEEARAFHSRQPGHKRRKALASVAILAVGLANLGLRIAELVGG